MLMILLVACGFLVGVFAYVFGWGGGIFTVPALIMLYPLLKLPISHEISYVIGTSLAVMLVNSLLITILNIKTRFSMLKRFAPLFIIVAIGALAGSFSTVHISPVVVMLFLVVVVCINIVKFSRKKESQSLQNKPKTKVNYTLASILGVVAGYLSALGGGGTNFILAPYLKRYIDSLEGVFQITTMCNISVALFGVIGYIFFGYAHTKNDPFSLGYIYIPALVALTLGTVFGVMSGVKVAKFLARRNLYNFMYLSVLYVILGVFVLKIIYTFTLNY